MTQSLERGLTVLEVLGERGEARLADLVDLVGGSRATVFRLLMGLEARGFVVHDRQEHVYRLGSAISNLANRVDASSLIQLAAPVMAALRARTSETVNLAALRRGRIVWVATIDGASSIRHATTIGDEVEVHCTGAGKAILGTLPESRWKTYTGPEPFPARTARTRTDLASLRREIARTVERGFAIDDGENELGGVCLAAPVVGRSGVALGAISVASIAQRMPAAERSSVGRAVQRACEDLSAQMIASTAATAAATPEPVVDNVADVRPIRRGRSRAAND